LSINVTRRINDTISFELSNRQHASQRITHPLGLHLLSNSERQSPNAPLDFFREKVEENEWEEEFVARPLLVLDDDVLPMVNIGLTSSSHASEKKDGSH